MDIKQQIENVNRLHRRHIAKLLTSLNQRGVSSDMVRVIKRHFSYYSDDIKDQVLRVNYQENKEYQQYEPIE